MTVPQLATLANKYNLPFRTVEARWENYRQFCAALGKQVSAELFERVEMERAQ